MKYCLLHFCSFVFWRMFTWILIFFVLAFPISIPSKESYFTHYWIAKIIVGNSYLVSEAINWWIIFMQNISSLQSFLAQFFLRHTHFQNMQFSSLLNWLRILKHFSNRELLEMDLHVWKMTNWIAIILFLTVARVI